MNICSDHTIYYFTVATKPHPGLDVLLDTCKFFGVNIEVLGMGDQRCQKWGDGLYIKVDYLKQVVSKLKPTDIILFTDAYDVLCVQKLHTLLYNFLEFKHPIVFSAENNCYPVEFKEYYKTETEFPYLNSGCYMGYTRAFNTLLTRFPDYQFIGNDQRYFHIAHLKNKDLICIDTKGILFTSMYNMNTTDINFYSGYGEYKVQKTNFIHFNGCKQHLFPVYRRWQKSLSSGSKWLYISGIDIYEKLYQLLCYKKRVHA